MKFQRVVVLSIAGLTGSVWTTGFAQKREITELQRDVSLTQDEVRKLQRTVDERMAALTALVQQTLDNVNKSNTSVAVLEKGVSDKLSEQSKSLVGPVAGLGAKLDGMTTEFQAMKESVSDLTSRMTKLQADIVDLSNTVKVINAPPAPPPGVGTAPDAGSPPPGMSAKQVYDGAMRDRSGGNLDLALQGFDAYLKYYSNTELAPNAQFYVGQIYYDKNDFASALKAFDLVLERYPENNKTPDAMYMKGMALLKSGQATAAGREFLTVTQKFPSSEVATKARTQRKALGLSTPAAPAGRRSRR